MRNNFFVSGKKSLGNEVLNVLYVLYYFLTFSSILNKKCLVPSHLRILHGLKSYSEEFEMTKEIAEHMMDAQAGTFWSY